MAKSKAAKVLRSKIMRSVKSKNTGAELTVKSCIKKLGYFCTSHAKSLPGTPDIVLRKHKKVIFVNGCFWHWHGCSKGQLPKSNIGFWRNKVSCNQKRDKRNIKDLKKLGI